MSEAMDEMFGKPEADDVVVDTPVVEPAAKGVIPEVAPAAPEVVPPTAPEQAPTMLPLSAILDEREKRQQYQREAEELRRWKQEREAKEQAAQQKQPDFYENPDEYMRQVQAQQQHAVWNERLNMSELRAADKFGPEKVDEAAEAFKVAAAKNPALVHEFTQQRDPYGFVMQWHTRNSVIAEIGEDPAAYKERIRAELLAELQPAAAQTSAPRLPGSLASQPTNGATQPDPKAEFNSLFSG